MDPDTRGFCIEEPGQYSVPSICNNPQNDRRGSQSKAAMAKRIFLWELLSALIAILVLPGPAVAADSVYAGSLVQVAPGSFSIRLPDGRVVDARLPKSGDLAAESIAQQYNLADQVEITAKSIDAYLDKQTDHYYFLELKKLRLLRSSSPEDLT